MRIPTSATITAGGLQGGRRQVLRRILARFPEDKDAVRSYIGRIIKDKDPLDKGIALAEKLEELAGYPLNPSDRQDLAQLYTLKGDPAKSEEVYGKDFIDDYKSNSYYALMGYATSGWIRKNLESAEAAADLALKIRPDDWYAYAQVAGIYNKVNKTDKALAIFGPSSSRSSMANRGPFRTTRRSGRTRGRTSIAPWRQPGAPWSSPPTTTTISSSVRSSSS